MRVLSPEFAQHLASGQISLCNCWRLVRKDGLSLGFTDHDEPVVFDGVSHDPAAGFEASERAERLGATVDTADVLGVLDNQVITEHDIALGRYDGATITTFRVNWRDPNQRVELRTDYVGEIRRQDGSYIAELRALSADLNRVQGRRYTPFCDAELGDQRCGVDLNQVAYSLNSSVSAIRSDTLVELTGAGTFPAGWCDFGLARWTSGTRVGLRDRIAEHQIENGVHLVRFVDPVGKWAQAGDTFELSAGCDRQIATCRNKFNNAVNFRGFPHVPGNDAIFRVPQRSDDLSGNPIVP